MLHTLAAIFVCVLTFKTLDWVFAPLLEPDPKVSITTFAADFESPELDDALTMLREIHAAVVPARSIHP